MKFTNGIFYLVLLIGFILPSNSTFYIPIAGALISCKEMAFLLLPIINPFCASKNNFTLKDNRLKNYILFFLGAVLLAEILKVILYNQPLPDIVKSLRNGLPLFSSLIVLFQGIRANIEKVWRTILWAVSLSVIISIFSLFVSLPIYYDVSSHESVLAYNNGRIVNSNAAFGLIGMYILFQYRTKWYTKGKLVFFASILSITALVLTFNRTLLALLFVLFCYQLLKDFRFKRLRKAIFSGTIVLFVFWCAYASSPLIHRQVDKRFFMITGGETTIVDQTIEGNRDFMYEGAVDKIKKGYWAFGIPYALPIFYKYDTKKDKIVPLTKMDVSLINLLIRNGILALVLFLIIYNRLRKKKYLPPGVWFVFLLSSLNIDTLYNLNAVFFLIIFMLVFSSDRSLEPTATIETAE